MVALNRGPKPNIKMIEKVSYYRVKGLSMREIAKLINRDEKQVRRWLGVRTILSTGAHLRGKSGATIIKGRKLKSKLKIKNK